MRSQASHDTAVSMASRYSARELSLISASSGANVAFRLWRSSASETSTTSLTPGEVIMWRTMARRTGEISSNSAARCETIRSMRFTSESRGESSGMPDHCSRSWSAAT